jgi:hypothetical protein
MKRTTLSALIGGLFIAAPALADDIPWITEGALTAGGLYTKESGRDSSKREEYQDLNSGVLSNVFFRGRDDKNWVDFYGENFGRDDQYTSSGLRHHAADRHLSEPESGDLELVRPRV